MLNPFKSSRVQAFKVLGLFSVLTLELLNPLNLEQLFAQADIYQGKTLKVIVGTAPGGGYDLWGAPHGTVYRQTYSRPPDGDRAKHARRRRCGRGELSLQFGQTGRSDRHGVQSGALFCNAPRPPGNQIRL